LWAVALAAVCTFALAQNRDGSPAATELSSSKTPTARPRITGASNPGGVSLSVAKLKPFQDELTGNARSFPQQLTNDRLDEHLQHGDSRAAVVIRTQPDLLVAAYSDELDCVILLRFDSKLATQYGLSEGSRLLTVNTYGRRDSPDVKPGPKAQHRWTSVYPLIAEFLSDDVDRLRTRKQEIADEEWNRAFAQGKSDVEQPGFQTRNGNPYLSGTPARAGGRSSPDEEALRSAESAERAGRYEEALRIYRDGAEKGDARAQVRLGWLYLRGLGVSRDDAEALHWFRKAAEQGEPHAAATLGQMYGSGRGVTASDAEAVKWLRIAADAGVATGQFDLGVMYRSGRGGLPQDDAKALEWFRAAAAQGNPQAEVNIGVMYEKGIAVPKDLGEAAKWYAKAADRGYSEGQRFLGDMYASGMGVPKDAGEAIRWYQKAADQGDAAAKQALASLQSPPRPAAGSAAAPATASDQASTFTPSFPIESTGSGPCRLSVERIATGEKPNQMFVIRGAGFKPDTELKVISRS
jgi:TPR repeat protein